MTIHSPGADRPAIARAASTAPSLPAGQATVAVAVAPDASAPAAWLPLYLTVAIVQAPIAMQYAPVGLGAVSGALCGWALWRSAGPAAIRSARGSRATGRR